MIEQWLIDILGPNLGPLFVAIILTLTTAGLLICILLTTVKKTIK